MGLPWKLTSLTWREKTNTFQFRRCKSQMSHENVPLGSCFSHPPGKFRFQFLTYTGRQLLIPLLAEALLSGVT